MLAFAHRRNGDEAKAMALFAAVVALAPDHPAANRQLGLEATRREDHAVAERHFRVVTASFEATAQDWFELGWALMQQPRCNEEAAAACREAIARKDNHLHAHVNLARE